MLLTFVRYLGAKLPRDKVVGPWIKEIQALSTRGKHRKAHRPTPKAAVDSNERAPDIDR
jgi:hypothetical protein